MKLMLICAIVLALLAPLAQAQEPDSVLWVFGKKLMESDWHHHDQQVYIGYGGAEYLVYAPPSPKAEDPPPTTSPTNYDEWEKLLRYQLKHAEPLDGETEAQAQRRVGETSLDSARSSGFIMDWRWEKSLEVKLKSLADGEAYWQLLVFNGFKKEPSPTQDELCEKFLERVSEVQQKSSEVFIFYKGDGVMPEICAIIPCVAQEQRAELRALLRGETPDSLFWFKGYRGEQIRNPRLP